MTNMETIKLPCLLHWIYSHVADELQFSGPCDREESSDSPDDSRKNGLLSHL